MCLDDTAPLKLNENKTEFLVTSSPYFQESVHDTSLKVRDAVKCHNLGVIFNSIGYEATCGNSLQISFFLASKD